MKVKQKKMERKEGKLMEVKVMTNDWQRKKGARTGKRKNKA